MRVKLLKRKPFLKQIFFLTHRNSNPQQSQYFRFAYVVCCRYQVVVHLTLPSTIGKRSLTHPLTGLQLDSTSTYLLICRFSTTDCCIITVIVLRLRETLLALMRRIVIYHHLIRILILIILLLML